MRKILRILLFIIFTLICVLSCSDGNITEDSYKSEFYKLGNKEISVNDIKNGTLVRMIEFDNYGYLRVEILDNENNPNSEFQKGSIGYIKVQGLKYIENLSRTVTNYNAVLIPDNLSASLKFRGAIITNITSYTGEKVSDNYNEKTLLLLYEKSNLSNEMKNKIADCSNKYSKQYVMSVVGNYACSE